MMLHVTDGSKLNISGCVIHLVKELGGRESSQEYLIIARKSCSWGRSAGNYVPTKLWLLN